MTRFLGQLAMEHAFPKALLIKCYKKVIRMSVSAFYLPQQEQQRQQQPRLGDERQLAAMVHPTTKRPAFTKQQHIKFSFQNVSPDHFSEAQP